MYEESKCPEKEVKSGSENTEGFATACNEAPLHSGYSLGRKLPDSIVHRNRFFGPAVKINSLVRQFRFPTLIYLLHQICQIIIS